ncbi:hypothetical protein QZH41_015190 [Actinostola sp. cb2023]|nr:hypothetical protein QZH41_015190 [Actinostola sp. cb2023]
MDPSLWFNVDEEMVDVLPYDIDGLRVFRIPYEKSKRNMDDGRKWKPWVTSSRKGFAGKRNVQSCKGSHICTWDDCPYLKQFGKPNNVQFFNVLQDFTSNPSYIFNPTGWMFDEAGGNWHAIQIIFGEKAVGRSVSCEFHFYQCTNRQVGIDWSDKAKYVFKNLVRDIFEAPTPYRYEQARKALLAFAEEKNSKRGHVLTWFKWWHKRRTHIFKAFKSGASQSYSQCEPSRAKEDIAESIMLSKKLEAYGYGGYQGGHHRSQTDRLKIPLPHTERRKSTGKLSRVSVFDSGKDLQSSDSEEDSEADESKAKKKESRNGRFRPTASKAFVRSLELAKKGNFSVLDHTRRRKKLQIIYGEVGE